MSNTRLAQRGVWAARAMHHAPVHVPVGHVVFYTRYVLGGYCLVPLSTHPSLPPVSQHHTGSCPALLFTTQFSSHTLPTSVMMTAIRGLMAQKAMARDPIQTRDDVLHCPCSGGTSMSQAGSESSPQTLSPLCYPTLPVPMDNPLCSPSVGDT